MMSRRLHCSRFVLFTRLSVGSANRFCQHDFITTEWDTDAKLHRCLTDIRLKAEYENGFCPTTHTWQWASQLVGSHHDHPFSSRIR